MGLVRSCVGGITLPEEAGARQLPCLARKDAEPGVLLGGWDVHTQNDSEKHSTHRGWSAVDSGDPASAVPGEVTSTGTFTSERLTSACPQALTRAV